jgi:hypothetical protein
MPHPPGRPASPASIVCERVIEIYVRVDEAFRENYGPLVEAADDLHDYYLLVDAEALGQVPRTTRVISRRMARRADELAKAA